MKTLLLLVCLALLFPISSLGQEWKVEDKKVTFDGNCSVAKSEIMARLQGACSGDEFEMLEKGRKESNRGRISYTITSTKELTQFQKRYFKSSYFQKIPQTFFKDNKLGVVFVVYTGSRIIKNEKLLSTKNRCGFSYETWDKNTELVPQCIWSTLYLVKLKR